MFFFIKYYTHLFNFKLSITENEAEAKNWLAARDVEKFVGNEYTTKKKLRMDPCKYITGRGIGITIPKGSTFIVKNHEKDDFLATLDFHETNDTFVTVRGDELHWIVNSSNDMIEDPEDVKFGFVEKVKSLVTSL